MNGAYVIYVILGIILGAISLVGTIFIIGVWKGQVDSGIRDIKRILETYPLAEMSSQIKTMYTVYVIDALKGTRLSETHSPPVITEEGIKEIPQDIKDCLSHYTCKSDNYGYEIIQCLTMDRVQAFALSKGWTMQIAVSLLSLYLKKITTCEK